MMDASKWSHILEPVLSGRRIIARSDAKALWDEYLQESKMMDGKYRDLVQDLWGMGLTVVPRIITTASLFEAATAPAGMAYQWHGYSSADGWNPVPCERHPGLFAPYGYQGNVELNGLFLMERPKAEVDAFHAAAHARAHKNVDDWFLRQSGGGFVGHVTVLGEDSAGKRTATVSDVGEGSSYQNKIPSDMFDHLPELLRERDRLVAAAMKASIEVPGSQAQIDLKRSCMELAIDTIRKKYAKGNEDERGDGTEARRATENDGSGEGGGSPAESGSAG
jgi:hypothetical protein